MKHGVFSPEEEIQWALTPFGGIKITRVTNPISGFSVFEARAAGAKLATGDEILAIGSTPTEAILGLWELLTEREGSYILSSGNQYKWKSGLFQQELQI